MTVSEIVRLIYEKKLDATKLNKNWRRSAIQYLRLTTNLNQAAMANMFGVTTGCLSKDVKALDKALIKEDSETTEKMVSKVYGMFTRIYELAVQANDLWLAERTVNDFVDKLGRMGLIPYRSEVANFNFGDLITDGGRKSVLKVESRDAVSNFLTAEERNQLDRILTIAMSRKNEKEPVFVDDNTPQDSGKEVQF